MQLANSFYYRLQGLLYGSYKNDVETLESFTAEVMSRSG